MTDGTDCAVYHTDGGLLHLSPTGGVHRHIRAIVLWVRDSRLGSYPGGSCPLVIIPTISLLVVLVGPLADEVCHVVAGQVVPRGVSGARLLDRRHAVLVAKGVVGLRSAELAAVAPVDVGAAPADHLTGGPPEPPVVPHARGPRYRQPPPGVCQRWKVSLCKTKDCSVALYRGLE